MIGNHPVPVGLDDKAATRLSGEPIASAVWSAARRVDPNDARVSPKST
jgi:hypothetical protein